MVALSRFAALSVSLTLLFVQGWMRSDAGTGAKPRHPLQSWAEYRSQFSTFAILTSPLILGNVSALPITF